MIFFLFLLQGILERLDSGEVVVGDGSFLITLEKRGYVKAGLWTPEAIVDHPDAGQCRRLPRVFIWVTICLNLTEGRLRNNFECCPRTVSLARVTKM